MRVVQERQQHHDNQEVKESIISRCDDAELEEDLPVKGEEAQGSDGGEEQPRAEKLGDLNESSCEFQVTIGNVIGVEGEVGWQRLGEEMVLECCEVPPMRTAGREFH